MTIEDLCTTCRHCQVCTFNPPWRDPVGECEAYAPLPEPGIHQPVTGTRTSHLSSGARVEDLLGLCRNCCRRHVCEHDQPAGGVWHCAEYC